MTIGIRSNLVVSLKKKWQFVLFQFFRYLCFTGISGNLAETPILKDIFIFLANGHSFQKCSFLVDIVGILREVFSVFEKCQFLVALFPFVKKMSFYAKSVSFWPNEWIFKYTDKIMSCKLWSKVTSVFLNINFCAKMSILGKKNWISWEILIFSNNCALLLKLLWKTCFFFSENFDFLCDCLYTSRNCRILIKTSIFLRKCLFVHVLIFIRVFLLLENCYFDSKYHFIRWHFGQKYHFSNNIYISVGINSLQKSSNFLRKGVNLVVSFGKNDVWFLK